MHSKPLGTLLLITVAFADSRYSWGKYKSIVRDDGLRKGTPLQQESMQDYQRDDASPAEHEDASNTDPKMQATALAEASPESDASPEAAAATDLGASDESKSSTSPKGNSSDFVETTDVAGEGDKPDGGTAEGGETTAGAGEPGKVEGNEHYPFVGTDVMPRLKDSIKREVNGNYDSELNYGADENFVKSNRYFQEIVKDVKNLAQATDAIQLELKEHKKALDDFKKKQNETTQTYNDQMKIVKDGFKTVKDAAALEAESADGKPTSPHDITSDTDKNLAKWVGVTEPNFKPGGAEGTTASSDGNAVAETPSE